MRRISSRMTFFNKRVFPVVYFGLLLAFMAVPLALSIVRNTASPPLAAFIVPAILIVGGYFLMRRLIFILVDEVWDDGNVLVIKNRGERERDCTQRHQDCQLLAVCKSAARYLVFRSDCVRR